jgi:hypothetical protein
MVIVLVLRPSGLTGGRELLWPFTRAIRRSVGPVVGREAGAVANEMEEAS